MTAVTKLTDTDVYNVKKNAGRNASNNISVTTSMYYDNQGVIYKVADGNASVFGYAPGVGKTLKGQSAITIPSVITYDTVNFQVTSIEEKAFTNASQYFNLKHVIVPKGIKISDNSGIPSVKRITPNTTPASLAKLGSKAIIDLSRSDLKNIGKTATKVSVEYKDKIDMFTYQLSSKQIPPAGRAVLANIKVGTDKSVPTVRVNPTAHEMSINKGVKQGPYSFYSHSNLGWLRVTDVDGATSGYGAKLAVIASYTRAMYADGIDAQDIYPVPEGLTAKLQEAWSLATDQMARSAQVVFDEMTRWLEDSDTSGSVVTELNNMKIVLAAALAILKKEGFDASDLFVALEKQIATIAGLVKKIETAPISTLTPAQVGALTPAAFAGLTPDQVAAFFAGFTQEHIRALPPAAMAGLKSAQVGALTPTAFAGFTQEHIRALSPAAFAGLRSDQVAAFTPDQVAAFSPEQIKALPPAAFAGLKSDQVAAFTPDQVAAFTPTQVTSLTTAAFAGFLTEQIKALTPDQVAALTPDQVAALTPAQVAVLTPVQTKAFTPEQVAALTTPQIKALSTTQVASLTPDQVAALSTTQVSNPPSNP